MDRVQLNNYLSGLKTAIFVIFLISFFLPFLGLLSFFSSFSDSLNLFLLSRVVIKSVFVREDMALLLSGSIFLLSLYLTPLLYIIFYIIKKYLKFKPVNTKKVLIVLFSVIYVVFLFNCYLVMPPSSVLIPFAALFIVPAAALFYLTIRYYNQAYLLIENSMICFMHPAVFLLFWNYFTTRGKDYLFGASVYFFSYAALFIIALVEVYLSKNKRTH